MKRAVFAAGYLNGKAEQNIVRETEQLTIGERIKQLRLERGLTLRQLAAKTGLSLGYLSKVERGLSKPSYSTVQSICYALEMTANPFMFPQQAKESEEDGDSYLIPSSKRSLIYGATNLFQFESVFEENPHFKLNVMTLQPGCEEQVNSIHSYDEIGIVAEGRMEMELEGGAHYEMGPGDAVMIRKNTHHSSKNLLPTACISYWIEIL